MNRTIVLRFVIGIAIGLAIGGATGLLLAPSSGEEFRKTISDRAQYVQDEVQRAANERRAELEQQLSDLRAPRRINPKQSSSALPS